MDILNKSFPALEALANLKDLSPMQILRHAANAIVEASEIAQNIQLIRDEIKVLREQVEVANASWTHALAARDRAVEESERLGKQLAAVRVDLESVNAKRIDLENDLFEEGRKRKECEAQLSLVRADLARANERREEFEKENASLRNSLTQANDEIAALVNISDMRLRSIENLMGDIKQANERLGLALEAQAKAEARLEKILDVLTA
jgi:predicted  nucleic acid-binding Zn-ribbon protein